MAFPTNIAAINAANAFLKAQGLPKEQRAQFFKIEKLDGEWHSRQIAPFPAPRDPLSCLMIERDGIYPFPKAGEGAEADATKASEEDFAAAQAAADRAADAQQSAGIKGGKEWIRMSTIERPTKMVHVIADEMVAAAAAEGRERPSRKEIQDECVRRGIASGTARTQYQAWKKANDNAAANAANAAALSAAFSRRI